MNEEGRNNNRCETNVSLDEMDVSATQSLNSIIDPTNSLVDAATLLGDNIRQVGLELNRSIGFKIPIQEKVQTFHMVLGEIEGLTKDEHSDMLNKIPDHPMLMLVKSTTFYAINMDEKIYFYPLKIMVVVMG
ncbi:hypothetical protein Golob_026438 [Gossypium lobatum]|uniref:Uncharacterized protein n=2 Tax=Gossypium TaxID=3633 RepID=A0A7J8LV46_9ROSI|nr:hypothetical protein [Gossypium lobatum]